MTRLSNAVETVVIALEDETALTNLQAFMETVSPPAPKYYIVHAIPAEDSTIAQPASSERCKAEAVLQKCQSWLKSKYSWARIESCLVEGRFDEEIIVLVHGLTAPTVMSTISLSHFT